MPLAPRRRSWRRAARRARSSSGGTGAIARLAVDAELARRRRVRDSSSSSPSERGSRATCDPLRPDAPEIALLPRTADRAVGRVECCSRRRRAATDRRRRSPRSTITSPFGIVVNSIRSPARAGACDRDGRVPLLRRRRAGDAGMPVANRTPVQRRRLRAARRLRCRSRSPSVCAGSSPLPAGAARSASPACAGRAPLALGDLRLDRVRRRRLVEVLCGRRRACRGGPGPAGSSLSASWSTAAFMSRAVSRARSVRPLRWTVASATCESAIDGFRSTASSISTSVNSWTRRSSF